MSPEFKPAAVEVTDEWKAKTTNEMAARHLTRAMLAKRLGVTRGAISQLFKTTKSSDLVPKIDALLAADAAVLGYVSAYEKLTEVDRNLIDKLMEVLTVEASHLRTEQSAVRRTEHSAILRGEIIERVRSVLPKMTPDGRVYLHEALAQEAVRARGDIDKATKEMLDAQRALFSAQQREQHGRSLLERLMLVLTMFTQEPVWKYDPSTDDVIPVPSHLAVQASRQVRKKRP